jgi:uncharacterized protein (TIGR03085 family)
MSAPIDVRERLELCDLLLELGPDAPTLCEGWTTADLAAHLVLREHFHRWSDAQRAVEKAKGLGAMVARLRAGAPLIPWRLPRVRRVLNGLEYFIHHEDARRANGRDPRPPVADLEALCWRMTGFSARRVARRIRPVRARADSARRSTPTVWIGEHGDAQRSGNRTRPLPQRETLGGTGETRWCGRRRGRCRGHQTSDLTVRSGVAWEER